MERLILLYVNGLPFSSTRRRTDPELGLWMQDKPALQQRLARDLAALPSALKPDVVLPFFRAFWLTIAREWSQIEALRLDKYLYLIRQYVNASFKWLSKNEWKDKSKLEEYMEVLEEIPLNPVNMKIPNGLRFHVLDVYVDELEKVDDVWQTEKKSDTLDMLIRPVEKLTKDGKLKVIRKTAKECLDDDRVKAWRGEVTNEDQEMHDGDNDDDEEEEEEEWGGIVD